MERFIKHKELYVKNFVFGVEDSLASTVGLLSGIAAAEIQRQTIIITGLVLITVEAFSMAVGSFLAEESAEEYLTRQNVASREPLWGGLVMFFSYFFSGFIPLAPYFFMGAADALLGSIILSLAALFLLGISRGALSQTAKLRRGLKTMTIGGMAILAGIVVGRFFKMA